MKKITLILMLLGVMANAQVINYSVGDVVNDFTVTDTDGVEHNLYTITAAGKHVWLDFFFVDCVPCQMSLPHFNEFYDKYGCNDGEVYTLSINLGIDDDAYVEWYKETFGGPFNHAPAASGDGGSAAVRNDFGINGFPTVCLIGPDNTLLNNDIFPIANVQSLENSFPTGFEPEIVECTLAVADHNAFDFKIYPTVSNGNVTIDFPASVESSLFIYNMLGQRVYMNNYSENKINLNLQIPSGIYLVKVSAEGTSITKRIVIK